MTDEHALALAVVLAAAAELADANAAFDTWYATGGNIGAFGTHGKRLRDALDALYAAVKDARACGALR